MEQKKKIFKILSIDGGGIKGLYSSTVLEYLEEKYNCSISDHFDMLCGTSTGGLIALALSLKIPAKEISKLYSEEGLKIFPKMGKWKGYIKQALVKGKFSPKPLKNSLQNLFQDKKIKESKNLLCIPSFCLTNGQPRVFKKNHSNLDTDDEALYVDVALATSAAPTYFPVHEIDYFSRKQFVDGGVWANNPTMVGLLEAITYFVGDGKNYDSIEILSISSLSKSNGLPIGSRKEKSFLHWKDDLFETFMCGQGFFTHFFMEKMAIHMPVPIKYIRIPSATISSKNEHLVQMDLATKDSIDLMKSMGCDTGTVYSKKDEIAHFFKTPKTYIINN
jgi:hypothetical protein